MSVSSDRTIKYTVQYISEATFRDIREMAYYCSVPQWVIVTEAIARLYEQYAADAGLVTDQLGEYVRDPA
jgi:hypothetical protein